jgi:hypothetical protein
MKHHISKEFLKMACTCIVQLDLSGQVTLQQRRARTGRRLKMAYGVYMLYTSGSVGRAAQQQ